MIAGSLTEFTGQRKNAERYVVVLTMEVNHHTWRVNLIAAIASVLVALPFALVFGIYAILIVPLGIIAANVLFLGRQRRGLQVDNYRRLMNLRNSASGAPFIRGVPLAKPEVIMHQPVVVDDPNYDPSVELNRKERLM